MFLIQLYHILWPIARHKTIFYDTDFQFTARFFQWRRTKKFPPDDGNFYAARAIYLILLIRLLFGAVLLFAADEEHHHDAHSGNAGNAEQNYGSNVVLHPRVLAVEGLGRGRTA